MLEVTRALVALLEGGGGGALATVVACGGSAPQKPGARLLLTDDGDRIGTVGGGRIEQVVIEALEACLRDGKEHTLRRDLGRDLGMCCGGRMEVFIERVRPAPHLVIFGIGHVGAATARAARQVGFRVTLADEREDLFAGEALRDCRHLCVDPEDALRQLAVDEQDWFLITTHDHRLDERLLHACLSRPHRYVGMIGSKRKVLRLLQRLTARHGALDTSRLFAPVGLDLAACTPAEIAASIVAELVALRRGVRADHLRLPEFARAQVPVQAAKGTAS